LPTRDTVHLDDEKAAAIKRVSVPFNSKEPGSLGVFVTVLLGRLAAHRYKRYVDTFGLTGGEWVLDYGSGSGRLSLHIAQRLLQGDGHLTCVDVSAVWIDTVRRRLKKYPDVDFQLGDISSLAIDDDAYDVVVVHFVLHHLDEHERAEKVGVLARKLKTGGRLYIREPTREAHGTPVGEIRRLMAQAGLRERNSKTTHSLAMGRLYEEGMFEKVRFAEP
jgi:ubiquinone/menaquinone biosynthesis C-methylase UbiE